MLQKQVRLPEMKVIPLVNFFDVLHKSQDRSENNGEKSQILLPRFRTVCSCQSQPSASGTQSFSTSAPS